MPIFTVTGDDTIVISGRVLNDLATDDVTTVELPNDLVNTKTGKRGNSILAQSAQGFNGNVMIKVARGSSDDQYLNNKLQAQVNDFVGTPLLKGSFTKVLGDGQGNILHDTYNLAGGVISKIPGAKDNVTGDASQAETVYNLKFTNVTRAIE